MNYFVVTMDQKTITTNKTSITYEKGICNIWREMDDVIFFYLRFFDVLRIVQENKCHIWNPQKILDKKHVRFMQTY